MPASTAPDAAGFTCARRQVLLGAGAGGVVLVVAGCGGASGKPSGTSGSAGLIALKDVPSDSAVSVRDSTGRRLLLTRSGGTLKALDAKCTHEGCTVAAKGADLQCPCHGSAFTLTGQVTQGPAPTALHPVAVKIVSGQVELA